MAATDGKANEKNEAWKNLKIHSLCLKMVNKDFTYVNMQKDWYGLLRQVAYSMTISSNAVPQCFICWFSFCYLILSSVIRSKEETGTIER